MTESNAEEIIDYRGYTRNQFKNVRKESLVDYILNLPATTEETPKHIETLLLKINELTLSIGQLNDKYQVQTNVLEKVLSENKQLKKKVKDLEERLDFVEDDINKLDTYTRRNNIEVQGIPSAVQDDGLETIVKAISSKIGVEINDTDIEACHRLKSRDRGPKPVIVRFVNRRICEDIHKKKKNLKDMSLAEINGLGIHSRIFFNENLCPFYQKLFRMCYKLKKNGLIHSTWSFHGQVFYKKSVNGQSMLVTDERKLRDSFPDFFTDEDVQSEGNEVTQ